MIMIVIRTGNMRVTVVAAAVIVVVGCIIATHKIAIIAIIIIAVCALGRNSRLLLASASRLPRCGYTFAAIFPSSRPILVIWVYVVVVFEGREDWIQGQWLFLVSN